MKVSHTKSLEEINITPLTDIFLVLLIIMMVVAPLYNDSTLIIGVQSAQESTSSEPVDQDDTKSIFIDIDASGVFSVDGAVISPDLLTSTLTQAVPLKPNGVIVTSHADAPFESMAKAMDAAQAAKATNVTVVEATSEETEVPPAN
ncbi:MAG: biopolymer transporter ExbD [Candidatus Hydrogenedentes bacterium]|nr:biopolymer transporter ExbD [Candidatus Hydrogenedentota bacterium]